MGSTKNFMAGVSVIVMLLAFGGYYFSWSEGMTFVDALYYTFLTITTVGSSAIPSDQQGKIVTMLLVVVGMGAVLYVVTGIASALIEMRTNLFLKTIKGGIMKIRNEKDHVLLCGFGTIGRYVSEVLIQEKKKFIVIEKDPTKVASLIERGISVIQGDALDPVILKKANIEKAEVLIAALEDADNMYLIITASELNSNLIVAAKTTDEAAVKRLHKVGAQIVVMPEIVGGKELANAVLQMEKAKGLSTISKKEDST